MTGSCRYTHPSTTFREQLFGGCLKKSFRICVSDRNGNLPYNSLLLVKRLKHPLFAKIGDHSFICDKAITAGGAGTWLHFARCSYVRLVMAKIGGNYLYLFLKYASVLGQQCIDLSGDWFDHDGWFDIEKFHTFLQSKGCKVVKLQSASDRLEWGERLKQVVFKESIRGDVRLFDKSPQAQFVRCLTPPQDSIHHEFKGAGPSFSVSDGLAMSGNVALSIDLARGEVELLKVDLPDRNKAKDVSITYYVGDARTPKTMSLGRFSMHFGARAWGYAGASLMLAGSIGIGRDNVQYGASNRPSAKMTLPSRSAAPMRPSAVDALRLEG